MNSPDNNNNDNNKIDEENIKGNNDLATNTAEAETTDVNQEDPAKTAFEVWIGGKLVGIAKNKDELPVLVAAAKAQEKLRRKLSRTERKSKKSLRSDGSRSKNIDTTTTTTNENNQSSTTDLKNNSIVE